MNPQISTQNKTQRELTLFNELVPPPEITLKILNDLTYSERSTLSHVNRFFNNLCSDLIFWKHQCEKYFYPEQIGSDELAKNETWRSRFHNIMSVEKTNVQKALFYGDTDLTTRLHNAVNRMDHRYKHWTLNFLLYYFQHFANRHEIRCLLDAQKQNKAARSSGKPTFAVIDRFFALLFSLKSFWKKLATYADLLIANLDDLSVLPDMLEDPECFEIFINSEERFIDSLFWFRQLIKASEERTPHLTARFLNLLSSTRHFQTVICSVDGLENLLLHSRNQNVKNFLINRLIEPNNFAHAVRNMNDCHYFFSRIRERATETTPLSICHAMQCFLHTYLSHLNEILRPHSPQHAKSLLYFLLNTNDQQFPNLREALSCEKIHLQAIKNNLKNREYNSPEICGIIKQIKHTIKEITNTIDLIKKATLVGHQTLEFNKLKDNRDEFKPLEYHTLAQAEAFCHRHATLSLDYTWLIETLYKINNAFIPFKITAVKQLLLIAGTPETQSILSAEHPDQSSNTLDWRNMLLIRGNTNIFLNAYNNYASRFSPKKCPLNKESFLYFAISSGNLEFIEFMGRWYMENQADIALQTEVLPHILSIQSAESIKKITQLIINMHRPDLLLWLLSHNITLPNISDIECVKSNILAPYLTSYQLLLGFENDIIDLEKGLDPSYVHIKTTKTLASVSITSPITGATFTPIKLGGSSKQTTTLRFLHRLCKAQQLSQPMVDLYISLILTEKRILMDTDKHNKVLGRCLSYPEFRQSENPDNLFIMGKHFAEGEIIERDEIIANELFTKAKELYEKTSDHEKTNQCSDEIKTLKIDEKPKHRFLSFSGG